MHRPQFDHGALIEDCPVDLRGRVVLTASSTPLPVVTSAASIDETLHTPGTLDRRLIVSVTPQGLRQTDRIVWSALSMRSFGGTFHEWRSLHTDYVTVVAGPFDESTKSNRKTARGEIATTQVTPGEIVITRSALGNSNLLGTTVFDLSLVPGGIAVDETVVRIPKLWTDEAKPISPEELPLELASVRHPPGNDEVDASLQLRYVIKRGYRRDEWSCSSETNVTLVDRESVRQPFWDIGTSSHNAPRDHWLALRDPTLGTFRAVFETPATANAFANWIRSTHSTTAARFSLGLFDGGKPGVLRPSVPVDRGIGDSFRPIELADMDRLRVGPLAEP